MHIARNKKFTKQHNKLSPKIQKQFADRLRLYLEDSDHSLLNIHSLKGKFRGLWSFNVTADIRVIFDDSYDKTIILIAIGSHTELYS